MLDCDLQPLVLSRRGGVIRERAADRVLDTYVPGSDAIAADLDCRDDVVGRGDHRVGRDL